MGRIGITTTVPVEAIFASGRAPLDLNNRFIAAENPAALVERAERDGYPRNMCAWIKGIYGAVLESDDVEAVIAVTHGDCSNTQALMETLRHRGRKVIPFAFPQERRADAMEPEIRKLAAALGATWGDTLDVHEKLKPVRESLAEIDRMTWQDGTVSGGENNLWLVSSSDFDGDAHLFAARARDFIREASARKPREGAPRIALIGIPPIFTDLFSFIESKGARVVFNEIPTQFRMPHHKDGLVEQYVRYTFPYDIFCRIDDIVRQIALRRVDAVIHYVQSFCFRQIQDIIVRDRITLPILTLEGDRPGPLDARTKIKLETFVEMLKANQKK